MHKVVKIFLSHIQPECQSLVQKAQPNLNMRAILYKMNFHKVECPHEVEWFHCEMKQCNNFVTEKRSSESSSGENL